MERAFTIIDNIAEAYVRVMSLHRLIPTFDSDLPDDERELHLREQRRLFYVALTRTRHSLVLSSVARLPVETAHRMGARIRPWGATLASRFMRELGPAAPPATGRAPSQMVRSPRSEVSRCRRGSLP